MNRQPKHSELDSELMELDHKTIFPNSAIMSTVLTFIGCWAGLFAVMTAGWLRWQFWPYVTMPLLVWLVVLCWPWWRKARDISMGIMDAQIQTIEAWTARAGYSIDLNGDGQIGRQTVTVIPPATVRPLIVSSAAQGLRLLASDAPAAFDAPGLDQVAATLDPPARRPKQWELPNGATVDESTLEKFIDGIFIKGLARGVWAGPDLLMERDQYEGCMALLESAGLLTGRRSGYSGRLTLDTAQQVREVLGLGQGGKDD
jgi:hypothetical protein